MQRGKRIRVGVIYGGRSVEHEVSVITGIQVAYALDRERFTPIPIYVDKDGTWFTGDEFLNLEKYDDLKSLTAAATAVRPELDNTGLMRLQPLTNRWFSRKDPIIVDVVLVAMHGAEGENGALQGMFDVMGIPYTGCGVAASALGMDKALSKTICRAAGIPVLDDVVIEDRSWRGNEENWLDRAESTLQYPFIVKPVRLGSSIGIERANNRSELEKILEETFRLDQTALVEPCIESLREFNCSVLGTVSHAEASVIEEPLRSGDDNVLSYAEKYQRRSKGGRKHRGHSSGMAALSRTIPANIPKDTAQHVKQLAIDAFQALGCSGVARIDFLFDTKTEQIYFNEINTIPGSFSFYLWEPSGIPFNELLNRMLSIARERHRNMLGKVRSYETNLLSEGAASGLKGK